MSSCCTISQAEQLVSPFQCFLVFYFHVGGGIHSLKGRFFVGDSVRVLWEEIEINCMHWDFGPEVSLCTSGSNGFNFTLLTYQDQLSSCSNFQTKLIFDCKLTGRNCGGMDWNLQSKYDECQILMQQRFQRPYQVNEMPTIPHNLYVPFPFSYCGFGLILFLS